MGYSNRKPYLDLEKSQVEFFTSSTRFLKQSLDKESMFEKPYLESEYPTMQLRLPTPSWPSLTPIGPVGAFGPIERDLRWRYIFPPPSCGITSISGLRGGSTFYQGLGFGGTIGYGFGLDCGDVSVLSFRANSFFAIESWNWTFSLSSGGLDIGAIITQISGDTISLLTETPGVAGTVLVCAIGYGGQTPLVWETTYREGEKVRLFGGPPRIWNQLATQEAGVRCCEEVLFNCSPCADDGAMAWDYDNSAATVEQGNSVAIAVTGLNAPFEWSVSGTGFTLGNVKTGGLANTLIADANACGSATIAVTGCDGTSVVGYVRSTAGEWVLKSNDCELTGVGTVYSSSYFSFFFLRLIEDNKKQETNYYIDGIYTEREALPGTHAEVCGGISPCGGWIVQHCSGSATCLGHNINCQNLHGIYYANNCSKYDDICRGNCGCYWNGSQYEWYMDFVRYEIPTGTDIRYYEWECAP